jgi:hypothetical protein
MLGLFSAYNRSLAKYGEGGISLPQHRKQSKKYMDMELQLPTPGSIQESIANFP